MNAWELVISRLSGMMYDVVKCTPLEAGAVSALKVGDLIDIIGINRGVWLEYPGWLSFTECIFPKAGTVQFSRGGPVFAPAY